MPDVEVEVELRIGHPRRRRKSTDASNGTFTQSRHTFDRAPHGSVEVLRVDRSLEDRQRRATRVEPRVLLDVPHQRFVIGHAIAETLLSFACVSHVASSTSMRQRSASMATDDVDIGLIVTLAAR